MSRYKYCIVPQCKNTTSSTPDKLFFSVPTGEKRKEWCLVIGRVPGEHKTLSPRCNRFICEDHFNLPKDMENYMMWRTVGVGKLKLKKGVLPHRFECQTQQRCEKKSGPMGDQARRTSELDHGALITENKNTTFKAKKCGRIYIYKWNDSELPHNLEIEIEKEVKECVESTSEDKTNIIIKKEVDELETYVFNVHCDSESGAEYLIDIKKYIIRNSE